MRELPVTRAHLDVEAGPRGALVVGGPEEVIDKSDTTTKYPAESRD
jgi:hypothetical protein